MGINAPIMPTKSGGYVGLSPGATPESNAEIEAAFLERRDWFAPAVPPIATTG